MRRHALRSDESGSVLMMMAVALPVIILTLAMAMDFGNWYVHKSQLDNRVRAGALAAGVAYGTEFAKCADAGTRAAAETAIAGAAKQFSGAPGVSPSYNTTPGDASNQLTVVVNGGADDPCTNHPADGQAPSPLGGYWTDVRAVAGSVPSFFAGFGVPRPQIGASARVAILQADTVSGLRPLGLVSATSTSCVSATFAGAGTVALAGGGTSWSGTAPNMPSGNNNGIAVGIDVGCGSNPAQYDAMAFVSRLPRPGGTQLTNLQLTPVGTCTNGNPYFIPYDGSSCQMRITATVTFANPNGPKFVRAARQGGGAFDLNAGTGNDWTGLITIAPGTATGTDGLDQIVISARNAANGQFTEIGSTGVQAGTSADQGPIANVTVGNRVRSATQPIGAIGVTLRGLNSNDLLVVRSVADCDPPGQPNLNLRDTFEVGCAGPFEVATGAACQNSTADNNPPSPAGPFDCVGGTGEDMVSLSNGNPSEFDQIWAPGTTCTPKDWPDPESGDPRLITIFLSDAIPANQNASQEYRITGFAAFYVTGWDNSPSRCNGQNDPKPSGAPNGSIWGHVLNAYVIPPGSATAGQAPCSPTSTGICVAVLVK